MWREDPSRRAVWHAIQSTPATRATAAATEKEMLEIIAEVMRPLARGASYEERMSLAGLLVHTVSSLLNYAVRDIGSGPEYDEAFESIVEEIKRMLVSYLFSVATA
nr:hypothetical protein [Melaminivora alkalimesophila]